MAYWQSKRAKEESKVNGVKIDVATGQLATKLDEVHKTVNGRVDQLVSAASDVAKMEGYNQAVAENIQKVSSG